MGWFCPTFQRPERLAELAMSWEKCNPGHELHVRVWKDDPRKEVYLECGWPDGWTLYESDKEWAGEAFNEYYDKFPEEPFYGFIGDDIVLRTKNGLKALEVTAGNMFFAYPNDTIHRHNMTTHYCLGGGTARALGCVTPRIFYHYNMDRAMQFIMFNCGLQRYCPQVIFHHRHFLRDDTLRDDTYRKVYGDMPLEELDRFVAPDEQIYQNWEVTEGREMALKLRKMLLNQYEHLEQWELDDMEMRMMGSEI